MAPRVLMVHPHGWYTGAGRSLVNLVAVAGIGGFEPVVAMLRHGPLVDELREMDAEVHVVLRGKRLRDPRGGRRALRGLLALARETRPDLVYSSESMAHLFGGTVARRLGLPAVWRQPAWPVPWWPLELGASLVPAEAVVVASRAVAERQRRMPRSPPIRLIPPGIDLGRPPRTPPELLREQHGIPAGAPLIGIVGRLDRWKGHPLFLRAAALARQRRPDLRFAVIGGAQAGEDESFARGLHDRAAELGIADAVTFTGQSDDAPGWMRALDVVVNASDHEPFGLVVVEALQAGRPVVALADGGPADIVDHGETGLLVDRADPALLADALVRLADDPGERARMGARGRVVAAERYSRDRMGRDFGALFAELADDSRRYDRAA